MARHLVSYLRDKLAHVPEVEPTIRAVADGAYMPDKAERLAMLDAENWPGSRRARWTEAALIIAAKWVIELVDASVEDE